jgi:hypothetical protein
MVTEVVVVLVVVVVVPAAAIGDAVRPLWRAMQTTGSKEKWRRATFGNSVSLCRRVLPRHLPSSVVLRQRQSDFPDHLIRYSLVLWDAVENTAKHTPGGKKEHVYEVRFGNDLSVTDCHSDSLACCSEGTEGCFSGVLLKYSKATRKFAII